MILRHKVQVQVVIYSSHFSPFVNKCWRQFRNCRFKLIEGLQSPGPSGMSIHVQQETWRIGGVSTGFLILDLGETFTESSKFIRNFDILIESRKRLESHWSLQLQEELPFPNKLNKQTWRTGGVLTGFFNTNPDETFTDIWQYVQKQTWA